MSTERGTAANAPLVDRRTLSKAQRESDPSFEGSDHPGGQSTRSKSERTIDLKDTHAYRDTINDRNNQQVDETRNTEDNRKREVTSRQKLINHQVLERNEKKINLKRDEMNVSEIIKHVRIHDKL